MAADQVPATDLGQDLSRGSDVGKDLEDAKLPDEAHPGDVTDMAQDVTPPPVPYTIPDTFMAMCPLDGKVKIEEWDRLEEWGVKIARQGFFWDGVQKDDGTFDFTWSDEYFDEAEKRGIKVLAVFDYDRASIHGPDDPRPSVPLAAHEMWLSYVNALASRYKDRAWGFEVWNEPNLPAFWKGSQEEFVALAKATVAEVHKAAPGVPVSVAGISLFSEAWFDALEAQGVVSDADAISFHPYWLGRRRSHVDGRRGQEMDGQEGLGQTHLA